MPEFAPLGCMLPSVAYLLRRERVREELRRQGGIGLDVPPARLPAAMVNQYLDLKRGGWL